MSDGTPHSSQSSIDRTETVRLLTQALKDLGYGETAKTLEAESGIEYESTLVQEFRQNVLSGRWNEASMALADLPIQTDKDAREIKFLIGKQRYLELLEARKCTDAMWCLRKDVQPYTNPGRVRLLSSLLICPNADSLYTAAKWDGARGHSRSNLMTIIQGNIASAVLLPPRRLEALLRQALELQQSKCLYHNPREGVFSLYEDHICDRNLIPKKTLFVLDGHSDEVWHIAFSHSGKYLASASKDTTVCVWDVSGLPNEEPKIISNFCEHTEPLSFVSWSPDDSMIATCGNDCVLRVWDPMKGTCLVSIARDDDDLTSCAWLPDGASLVSGGRQCVYQWDLSGQELRSYHGSRVTDLAVSEDGRRMVVVSLAKIVVYNLQEPGEDTFEESGPITSISLSRNGRFLLVNLLSSELHVWDLCSMRLAHKYWGYKQGRFVIRSCFGGTREAFVISGSEDSQVYVWHRDRELLLDVLPGHTGTINAVAWNPVNPHVFASCSDDHTVRVWGIDQAESE